ncbi:MAG: class I SAM-dependent methyltransferase [Candidatus Staskawiczbacteria bacterium]|nr:class I SAM-dependent methyltransferase [Candidatus Staskawiczbacteria bacterium]
MKPRAESEKERLNLSDILVRLAFAGQKLEHDTKDTHQLNPVERLVSIKNVWDACKAELGNVETAIDVGSGFGYGTVFLETEGIKTIGIENVGKKIKQGVELFHKAGVDVKVIDSLDFQKSPAFIEADFNSVEGKAAADLITVFYVGPAIVDKEGAFEKFKSLLKENGKILVATNAGKAETEKWLEAHPIPFSHKIIEVPDNFEKTAIILEQQK